MYPTNPYEHRMMRQADAIISAERTRFAQWRDRRTAGEKVRDAWQWDSPIDRANFTPQLL